MRTTGLVLGFCVLFATGCSTQATPASLQMTGATSLLGMELTNREARTVTACDVTIRDSHGVLWAAAVPGGDLKALETRPVAWERFEARGQRIPASVIREVRQFEVSCLLDGERRTVVLGG
jgi:hypothetical protein